MADDTTVLDDVKTTDTTTTDKVVTTKTDDVKVEDTKTTNTADTKSTVADWIEAASRGDEKRKEALARFTDPGAIYDALTETQKTLHTQGRVKIPDEKASDEDRAQFRKAVGVPEKPEDYKLPEEITKQLDDEDKAVLGKVIGEAHKAGGIMSHPDVVRGIHEAYLSARDEAAAQMAANAKLKHDECQAALEKEWPGAEKERNLGFATGVLTRYGDEQVKELLAMPMADGTRLGDYAPLVRMLAKMGREVGDDPYFAEISKSGSNAIESMEARKATIEAVLVEAKRTGSSAKFKEYDALTPELEKINAALARHKK